MSSPVDPSPRLRTGEEHVRDRADFEDKFVGELRLVDSFRAVPGGAEGEI